jgi:thiol-disulfide isomerase/thioredoxin
MYIVSGTTAVVIVVIGAIVVFAVGGGGGGGGGGHKAPTAPGETPGTYAIAPALQKKVESVALSALVAEAKAEPSGTTPPARLAATAPPLTVDGKPEILYMGAEWCPYCAAERWALVMALSKFGTFSSLRGTTSSSDDVYGSTPTFAFYKATYKSKYLVLVAVEEETDTHAKLQAPTAAQSSLFDRFDAPPYITQADAGSIPFVYFDGKFLLIGAQYDPSAIAGKSFTSAVPYMTSGTNSTSKDAEAAAGYVVGDICALTHDQPASVCSKVPASLIGITTSSKTKS